MELRIYRLPQGYNNIKKEEYVFITMLNNAVSTLCSKETFGLVWHVTVHSPYPKEWCKKHQSYADMSAKGGGVEPLSTKVGKK